MNFMKTKITIYNNELYKLNNEIWLNEDTNVREKQRNWNEIYKNKLKKVDMNTIIEYLQFQLTQFVCDEEIEITINEIIDRINKYY